jgi:Mrp family chromosome partitioning ATPase
MLEQRRKATRSIGSASGRRPAFAEATAVIAGLTSNDNQESSAILRDILTIHGRRMKNESNRGPAFMLLEAAVGYPRSAHVIVLGNEKGGSGKSTTCMHIVVGLLKAGQRVATIDLDSRQKSLTHYVDNRRAWAERAQLPLEMPTHYHVARGEGAKVDDNEGQEFNAFAQAITTVEHSSTATISSSSIRRRPTAI